LGLGLWSSIAFGSHSSLRLAGFTYKDQKPKA
jgi:hypothetical protein